MLLKSDILKQPVYKTGQVAKLMGVSIQTVIKYCEKGLISYGRTPKNFRIIEANDLADYLEKQGLLVDDTQKDRKDVIYVRRTSYKEDLDASVNRLKLFAIDYNVKDLMVLADVGSSLDDNRKKLHKLLTMVEAGDIGRIFVQSTDALATLGFAYIKRICDVHDVDIIAMEESSSDNLANDLKSVLIERNF